MKQKLLLVGLLMTGALSHAQVGIGTTTPNASSALDITSTTSGLLIPRMTTAQRVAIATPAKGLQVFDTTTNSLWLHNGTIWFEYSKSDLRVVGISSHLTQDAGIGNNGTNAGTGNYNIGIGANALSGAANTASLLTAVGYQALSKNTDGSQNTAIGTQTLANNTTGSNNTAMGWGALGANTTGGANMAIGYSALGANTLGNSNIAMGYGAIGSNTEGSNNVGYGQSSLNLTTGSQNTAVGHNALGAVANANNNVGVGFYAGSNITTGANNISIGSNSQIATPTASNQLNIGSAIFGTGLSGSATAPAGNIGIGTTAPVGRLDVETSSGDNIRITNGVSKWALTSTIGSGSSASNAFGIIDRVNGIRRMVFNDNGNVYLGGPIGSDTGLSSTISIVGSNVGIGNVTPTTKLDVVGTTTIGSSIQAINAASSTASANYIRAVAGGVDTRIQNNGAGYGMVGTFSNSDLILAANGGTFVYVKPSGRVGIGNGSPAYLLDVNGDINAAGAVRASGIALTSDVRLKKNIVPVKNALSSVMQLNAVSYDKKESIASNKYNTSEIGFIAQDLRKVFPALVSEGNDADKTLAVNYAALIPVLTKAIQEQQAKISELTARNEASETAFAKLAAEVKELKAAFNKK